MTRTHLASAHKVTNHLTLCKDWRWFDFAI